MTDRLRQRIDWGLVAAVALACVAAWPLMSQGGLVNTRGGGDSPFLLQRLHQLTTALADGHFPVRWMPDANYGYGYPFFNYYAPFAFYVAAIFRFLGAPIVLSIQLSQLAAFITAAVGMVRLGQSWFKRHEAALIASAAYTFAPFHLVNVYVRGDSIAEFWAMAWYPWVIVATEQLFNEKRSIWRVIGWIGLTYAALLMSHNISAMIFSPFPLLYAGIRWLIRADLNRLWRDSAQWRPVWGLAAGLGFGLLISAWFWVPALQERHFTRISEVTVGYFDYSYADGFHFRSTDLVQSSWRFDPTVEAGNAFRMGLIQALLIGAGLLSIATAAVRRTWPWMSAIAIIAGFALATLMITPASLFLWDVLPLLPYTQFPWRFLSIQAFWGAGLSGILGLLFAKPSVRSWGFAAGCVALLAWAGLGQLQLDALPLSDEEITAESLARYEWFTGNIGTTIGAEYLAEAVEPRLYTSPWLNTGERWPIRFAQGSGTATPLRTDTAAHQWRVDVSSDQAELILPVMYWPGWEASTRSGPIPIDAAESSGLIRLTLPEGEHIIDLTLGRTPTRLTAEWLSLISLLVVIRLFWGTTPPSGDRRDRETWALIGGLTLFFVGVTWLASPARPSETAPATWDFALIGYLHRTPEIRYGNGAALESILISRDHVEAGDSVTVDLVWSGVPDDGIERDVRLTLTTPATNFFNFVPPIAAEQQPMSNGTMRFTLDIPADAPAGLFVPRLSLSDLNRPRTAVENKRDRHLYLSPIRVTSSRTAELEPGTQIDLKSVDIIENGEVIAVEADWTIDYPESRNLIASWRLLNPGGVRLSQFDIQPFYGQQPTIGWEPGRPAGDAVSFYVDDLLKNGEATTLVVALYDRKSGEPVMLRRLGTIDPDLRFSAHAPNFELPDRLTPAEATLSDSDGTELMALRGYQVQQTEDVLEVTLYWEALGPIPADYTHFVHLLDPETGQPVAQHDAQPQQNSYPTTQWTPGEIVEDRAVLFLEGRAPAEFDLTAGFYRQVGETFPRLNVVQDGESRPGQAIDLR